MPTGNFGVGVPMIKRVARILIIEIATIISGKGGREMMAMLWAMEIMKQDTMEDARATYARVPRLLKEKVKKILIDSGMEEVVTE